MLTESVDETWTFNFTPDKKKGNCVSGAIQILAAGKVMATFCWCRNGMMLVDFLTSATIIKHFNAYDEVKVEV